MSEIIQSPYEVLELPLNALPEQVKKHYKMLIRKFPPEQKPVEFNRIRRAYDMLNTEMFARKAIFPLYNSAIIEQKNMKSATKSVSPQDLLTVFETPFNTLYELERVIDLIPFHR